MLPFPPTSVVSAFADEVLRADLPALPDDRRRAATDFIAGRVLGMPSPMRVGVGLVALAVAGLGVVAGRSRVVGFLRRHPLPVLSEYVRLVRSLGYAYVWELWPDTGPDGSPHQPAADTAREMVAR